MVGGGTTNCRRAWSEGWRTMVDDSLLAILRCPNDRSTLRRAEPDVVARLNEAVRVGRLRNRAGEVVGKLLEGGLVRERGDLLYPVVEQIPVMLHDEAIPLDQLAASG